MYLIYIAIKKKQVGRMNRISEVINDKYDNHIMPFLWMHGEEEAVIRKYIHKIFESGIKSVCIESRPHEDFLEEKWWMDVSTIVEECEKLGMTVWILDDKHFPTGYAAGRIPTEFPHLQKLFLSFYQLDVVGPKQNVGTLLRWTTRKRPKFMSVGTEEDVNAGVDDTAGRILSVVAARKTDFNSIDETQLIDITAYVKDDMLYWDIPEGQWTIFVNFETVEGGEEATSGYLNPLVAEATDVLIDTVYESHFEKFSSKFGNVIEGFFSDEPRFGNIKGSDAILGVKDMSLPWRPGMLSEFAQRLEVSEEELKLKLPLLMRGDSEDAHYLRFMYMDVISNLFKENFSKRIGNWCAEHHVKYIGHVIEDNNAHARLGYGSGHFFRSMAGQDMSGIDVVLHQLLPDQKEGYFKSMTANGWDGEFFHFALAKLGSSLSYLDEKKLGRTMCEVFGAYGWAEGTKLMKWIADHMLVRGVNYFVPHAFTMKQYPDPDCPPHFYAHGENPEFFGFKYLMDYMNKMGHLFTGGQHKADIAVLYTAEAEWSGQAMPLQKVTRVLTENQMEFEIVPCEFLERSSFNQGTFTIHQSTYKVLLVPYAERLPKQTIETIHHLAENGVQVIFMNQQPIAYSDAPSQDIEAKLSLTEVHTLDNLATYLMKQDIDYLQTKEFYDNLRYFHYKQGQSIMMLFNESFLSDISVEFVSEQSLVAYNVLENKIEKLTRKGNNYHIHLDKGEAIVLFEQEDFNDLAVERIDEKIPCHMLPLKKADWQISFDGVGADSTILSYQVSELPKLGMGDAFTKFSGTVTYELTFNQLDDFKQAYLDIENANEIVTVYVNDQKISTKISYPYNFNLSEYLKEGENKLTIEVVNNLGRYMQDFLSQYLDFEPIGLIGDVNIAFYD